LGRRREMTGNRLGEQQGTWDRAYLPPPLAHVHGEGRGRERGADSMNAQPWKHHTPSWSCARLRWPSTLSGCQRGLFGTAAAPLVGQSQPPVQVGRRAGH